MKPARIQPLNPAYHQLSQLLHQTLLSMNTISPRRSKKISLQKADIVLSLYERHIAKEEAILFAILHEYEPCVSAILLDDYRMITKQINGLRKMMTGRKETLSAKQIKADHQLLCGFTKFLNTCVAQMKEHQSIINPVLWRYYSDEELSQMALAFIIDKPVSAYSKKAVA